MTIATSLHEPYLRACIAALGWTLLHFCWQGVAIGLLAWALITLVRSPRVRYVIGCGALLTMLIAPGITLALRWPAPPIARVGVVEVPRTTPRAAFLAEDAVVPRAASAIPPSPRSWRDVVSSALPSIVGGWTIGVALLVAHRLLGLASIARLRRGATPIVDAVWIERLNRLAKQMSLGRPIALLATPRLDCPAVIGVLRPAILWPAAALTGLSTSQVEALLAHELAHIRRHDFAVNLVQSFVETLLFYHPAVWWLSARIRQEREHCCDDLAASVIGDRTRVADALAAMESHRQSASFLALNANGGSLVNRIRRLLPATVSRPASPRPRVGIRGLTATLAAIAVAVTIVTWTVRAQPVAAPPTPATNPSASPEALTDAQLEFAQHDAPLLGAAVRYQADVAFLRAASGSEIANDQTENLAAWTIDLKHVHEAIVARCAEMAGKPLPLLDAAQRNAAMPIGEYYMGGHVQRPGVYSLGGRAITIRQAIISAGMFDQPVEQMSGGALLIDVIRRDGNRPGSNREYTARLRWTDITSGKHDDLILMPNDQIMVGVNPRPAATTVATTHPQADGDTIHIDDLVDVTIVNLPKAGQQMLERKRVDAQGMIKLPYVDRIEVASRTPEEAGQRLASSLSKAGHPDCQVSVEIVPGEVRAPNAMLENIVRSLQNRRASMMPGSAEYIETTKAMLNAAAELQAHLEIAQTESLNGQKMLVKRVFEGVEATVQSQLATTQAAPVNDYQLHPNDVVQVSIMDLTGAGVATTITKRVTETGKITLPYVDTIELGGKTEAEAEQAIAKAYQERQIIAHAVISITTIERSDGRTIRLGAAMAPESSPDMKPAASSLVAVQTIAPAASDAAPSMITVQPASRPSAVIDADSPLAKYGKLRAQRDEIVAAIAKAQSDDADANELQTLRGLLHGVDDSIEQLVPSPGRYTVQYDDGGSSQERSLPGSRVVTLHEVVTNSVIDRPISSYVSVLVVHGDPNVPGARRQTLTWKQALGPTGDAFVLAPGDYVELDEAPASTQQTQPTP